MAHDWSDELEAQWCDKCETWFIDCNCLTRSEKALQDAGKQCDLFDYQTRLFDGCQDAVPKRLTPDEQQALKLILELHRMGKQ